MKSATDKWTPKRQAKWEKTRNQGRKRFVWTHVFYGSVLFLSSFLVRYVVRYVAFAFWAIAPQPYSTAKILEFGFDLICYLALGYWVGSSVWTSNEEAYRREVGKTAS